MLSELFDEQVLREQYDVALIAKSRSEGEVKGIMKTLIDLVKKGILTVPQAADQANLTVEEFEAKTGLKTT